MLWKDSGASSGNKKEMADKSVHRSDSGAREKFAQYTADTTLHGISQVTKSNTHLLRRLIWAVFFLGSFAWFGYYFVGRVLYYREFKSTTKITVTETGALDFPTVTFCNYNLIRKSYVINDDMLNQAALLSSWLTSFRSTLDLSNATVLAELNKINVSHVMREGAHLVNITFGDCRYRGKVITCSDYIEQVVTSFGYCYQFNSKRFIEEHGRLISQRTGSEYGLWLRMDTQQDEYYVQGMETYSAGFKVLIHDPHEIPLVDELGFAMGPGFEHVVSMKEVRVQKLAAPYEGSRCIDTRDPTFQNPLRYLRNYTKAACRLDCQARYIADTCNCQSYLYTFDTGLPACSMTESMFCVYAGLSEFAINDTIETSCDCIESCDELYYETSISASTFPAKHVLKAMEELANISAEYTKENYLEVKIFFEALSYELIEQIPAYSVQDLSADIGGQLGLTLGASILTVAEFGDFLVMLMISLCNRIFTRAKLSPSRHHQSRGKSETSRDEKTWNTQVKYLSSSWR